MACYIAFLRKTEGGTYEVEFPDLPGCVSTGGSLAQASAKASHALGAHLTALMSLGYPASLPSTEDQLAQDPRRGSADLMAYDLDLEMLAIANPLTYHTL